MLYEDMAFSKQSLCYRWWIFHYKIHSFFNDQWRLPEPVLSDDGNPLWHVFVMIYDSLQPAILSCGTFLLKIYLEYYKINNDNMPLKFTPCLLHKHLGKFWSFQGCYGKRR